MTMGRVSKSRRTFLKPVHRTAEFCSTCHKVHIPSEVTKYKDFLRGQNHYDGFLLSAASGHGARSFYYPPIAQRSCAGCHMPLAPSTDFGARMFEGADQLSIHNHLFAAANTALPFLRHDAATVRAEQTFLADVARSSAPVVVRESWPEVDEWRRLLDRVRALDPNGWRTWAPVTGVVALRDLAAGRLPAPLGRPAQV